MQLVQPSLPEGSLSPEVCGEIVQWTRMSDLPFLARTCKSFQIASEKKLYDILMLGNPTVAFDACRTIATTERLGPYVRELYVYQEERRFRSVTLHLQFWQVVQAAMNQMCHLNKLYIHDPSGQNTFILDPAHLNFQLDDVQLRMNWDDHVVAFLTDQRCLDRLTILRGPDNFERLLGPDALPQLKQFVGAITVATQLLVCPLTHLQVYADENSSVPLLSFIPRLVKTGATLRSLSIIHLPDPIALDALHLISTSCPMLCYVGILPFASRHRERFHRSLTSMHHLRVLELDITKWDPQPPPLYHSILTTELRIFCPSVEFIAFWVGMSRFCWSLQQDNWIYQPETGQSARSEPIWKAV